MDTLNCFTFRYDTSVKNTPKTDTISIFDAASMMKKKSFKTRIHSANNKCLIFVFDAVAN